MSGEPSDESQINSDELADYLAEEVAKMRPDQKFYSEPQIASKYNVTRAVARAALTKLRQKNLVYSVQGSGTYVKRRIDYLLSTLEQPSFREVVTRAGAEPRMVLLITDKRTLGSMRQEPELADMDEEFNYSARLGHINDQPAGYFEDWVAKGVVLDLAKTLQFSQSLTEVLRSYGIDLIFEWTRCTSDIAPDIVCEALGIQPFQETWLIKSVCTDGPDGPVVLISRTWLRQDVVRMWFEYRQ